MPEVLANQPSFLDQQSSTVAMKYGIVIALYYVYNSQV